MFLDDDALKQLTGYSQRKKQISQLRKMGIPFNVNAAGRPAVACAVIEGRKQEQTKPVWEPKWGGSLART